MFSSYDPIGSGDYNPLWKNLMNNGDKLQGPAGEEQKKYFDMLMEEWKKGNQFDPETRMALKKYYGL